MSGQMNPTHDARFAVGFVVEHGEGDDDGHHDHDGDVARIPQAVRRYCKGAVRCNARLEACDIEEMANQA